MDCQSSSFESMLKVRLSHYFKWGKENSDRFPRGFFPYRDLIKHQFSSDVDPLNHRVVYLSHEWMERVRYLSLPDGSCRDLNGFVQSI